MSWQLFKWSWWNWNNNKTEAKTFDFTMAYISWNKREFVVIFSFKKRLTLHKQPQTNPNGVSSEDCQTEKAKVQRQSHDLLARLCLLFHFWIVFIVSKEQAWAERQAERRWLSAEVWHSISCHHCRECSPAIDGFFLVITLSDKLACMCVFV